MNEIFKDLVVIELSSVLAGPAVGMFFAELGAKVIKFENINTGGDITRKWKLQNEDKDRPYSAYYCSVNYGKKVIMNDLSTNEGKSELITWIKKSDVIIANFKEKSAQRMGLSYEQVKEIKQDIIYAQLNGYPNKEKVAFDMVLQAESGFLSMCGTQNGEPAKLPVALIDLLAAHQLKEGILIALLKKYKTGKGSFVVSSLYESAIASLANQATNWLMNKYIPKRMGTLHPNIAPYGEIFTSKDNTKVVLAIGTDNQFKNLCKVLEIEELVENKKYKTNTDRVENRASLYMILESELHKMTAKEFLEKCLNENIPSGEVKNMKVVFEDHAASKMVIVDQDEKGNTRKRVKTIAFRVD